MNSRSAFQIGSIRKLRLVMDWTFDGASQWYPTVGEAQGTLLGLRELWLSINHIPTTEFNHGDGSWGPLRGLCAEKGFPIALIPLAMLPLIRVEVAFSSRDLCKYTGRQSRPAWSQKVTQDYAAVLQEMLLSPKGADLLRHEVEKHGLQQLRDRYGRPSVRWDEA